MQIGGIAFYILHTIVVPTLMRKVTLDTRMKPESMKPVDPMRIMMDGLSLKYLIINTGCLI